jgi:flagellar protein FlgJ
MTAGMISAAATAPPAKQETPQRIEKAASDFEALLIEQMLKSARESSGGDGESSTMMEIAEQQLSRVLSKSGGLGIGKVIAGSLGGIKR